MDITTELISIDDSDDLLNELEEEYLIYNDFVTSLYRYDVIKYDVLNHLILKYSPSYHSKELINGGVLEKIHNNKNLFPIMLELISDTIRYIKNKLCEYIIVFRDKNGHRLLSMCVCKKIRDSQFHLNITRSLVTTLRSIMGIIEENKYLSIELHKQALLLTGAKYLYAPPFEYMLKLLKNNFHYRELQKKDGDTDFFSEGFSEEELLLIKKYWPRGFVGYNVYRFWV
jgi:hypothetical protein